MYNSSTYRRPQAPAEAVPEKFRKQTQQIQELFPAWSNEDIQSALLDVNGDVDLAVLRISEGHAEQWGAVQRKKDKKSTAGVPQTQSKDHAAKQERGDFRGGKGGRGGRGGPGRGGAARGAFIRGGHQETNGRHAKHGPSKGDEDVAQKIEEEAPAVDSAADVNGAKPVQDAPAAEPVSENTSTPATWGGDTATNGSAPPASPAAPSQPSHPLVKFTKTPATSKLSWAQIAKPQEKPTPPAPAPAPAPAAAPAPPSPATQPTPSQPAPAPEPVQSEPQSESAAQGWEEPTTVQAPTWDDEPTAKPAEPAVQEEPKAEEEEVAPTPAAEPEVPPVLPAQVQPSAAKQEPVQAPAPVKPATPAQHTRPTSAAHRHKFKPDQAVIMPSGSFGTLEKVGMQFGSLSLGGDDLDSTQDVSAEPTALRAAEPAAVSEAPALPPALPIPAQPQESTSVATTPPAQTSLNGSLFQQGIPQQAQQQQQPAQVSPPVQLSSAAQLQAPASLQTSLSQPALPAQVSAQPQSSASASNISSYSHSIPAAPPSLPSQQHPQQPAQSQGLLSQQHQQYSQHGLASHLDQNHAAAQSPHAAPAPQQSLGGHSSYFRQQEPPYFHTATPPVSASQSQDGPYGSFGQLSGQLGHQNQSSHLGGFGGGDYPYGENQRNFYDSYSGQTGFSNRNMLGHDDIKGLPGAPQQQPHAAPGLPPSSTQPSQQLPQSGQSGSQGQPGAQGPQQGYPPPLPYYYTPYPQNQYYGSPYSSGYSVPQPFVKYPTVFQGPPGPQSAPSPASKQAPSSVQPQSPYGQGLYGQQHSSSPYGDIDYQHGHGQSVSGLPSNDYGKQLYGGSGQGMQGFMGLGQSSGPSSGAPLGQRSGGSPEAAYKPYGSNAKDVGTGVSQGAQQQGGRGGQQPQGGFYGQRFSNAGQGPQGAQSQQHQPQGQGPQAHLGYPQGSSDGSFYSYQPRQQGYWQ
ncbi:uncharacterized protein PHACADRAFT_176595 [Phanerochaete carnosa HHB-10118-sp]|uniref:RNA polymerase II degradation factor 1 n=1 Tax=Phanerochaete carnosa (strain HHB-10118-sp) TaxID=650164 RepID=K5W107_PHACS|nr:uncharacterized protein PHACADRAFT_176595 [Phanerochaete carnosa HHB-10118-sp]EKM52574.1 hypothetical protein PHACADRAFT_176595 [Phanerochaete carnosa HHB-10118-sp]